MLLQDGAPLPGLKSGLTLKNELSKETDFIGKGAQVESIRVKELRRTVLPHGSQPCVLW